MGPGKVERPCQCRDRGDIGESALLVPGGAGVEPDDQAVHQAAAVIHRGEDAIGRRRPADRGAAHELIGDQRLDRCQENAAMLPQQRQAAAGLDRIERRQMKREPLCQGRERRRSRLDQFAALAVGLAGLGDPVMQSLGEKGRARVAAGQGEGLQVIEEVAARETGPAHPNAAEVARQGDMGHQPALLRGEQRGQPRHVFLHCREAGRQMPGHEVELRARDQLRSPAVHRLHAPPSAAHCSPAARRHQKQIAH